MNVQQKMAKITFILMLASTLTAPIANSLIDEETNKVYVGNLDLDLGEDDLEEVFGKFGHVERVLIVRERRPGRSKGFGFVTFAEKAGADRAVSEANGMMLKGKPILVSRTEQNAGGGDRNLHRRGGGSRHGNFGNGVRKYGSVGGYGSGSGYGGQGYGGGGYGGDGYGGGGYGGGYGGIHRGYCAGFGRREYGAKDDGYGGGYKRDRRSG